MSNEAIEIIEDTGQAREGNHVSVHSYLCPSDRKTERAIVDAGHWFGPSDGSHGGVRHVKLKEMEPCSHEEAMSLARAYASEHGIGRIYVKRE